MSADSTEPAPSPPAQPDLPRLPSLAAPVAKHTRRQKVLACVVVVAVAVSGYALVSRTQEAMWYLPDEYAADPTSSTLLVLVREIGCTSGDSAKGRIVRPRVHVSDTTVMIAVRTRVRWSTSASCPQSPLAPGTVDLGQPLGTRTLVDAYGDRDDSWLPAPGREGGVQVPEDADR